MDSANVDRSLNRIYLRLCDYNQHGIAILGLKAKDFSKEGSYVVFSWPTVKGIEKYAEIYFKCQSLKEEKTKKRAGLKALLITAIKTAGLEKEFPVDSNNIDRSLKRIHRCLQNYCQKGIAPLGLTAEQLREEAPYMASQMLTEEGIKKYAEIYFKLQSHKEEKIKEKAALKERLIAAIKKAGLGKAFLMDSANVDRSLNGIYANLRHYAKKGVALLGLTAEDVSREGPYTVSRLPTVKGIKKYAEIYFKLQFHKEEKIKEKAALKERLIAAIKKAELGKAFLVDSANVDSSLNRIYSNLRHYAKEGIAPLGLTAEQLREEAPYMASRMLTVKGIKKYAEIYFKLQSHKEEKIKEKAALKERLIAAIKTAGLEKEFPVDPAEIDRSLNRIYSNLRHYAKKGIAPLGLTAEDVSREGPYTVSRLPTVKGIKKYAEIYFKLQSHKEEKIKEKAALKERLIAAIKKAELGKAFLVDSANVDSSLNRIYSNLRHYAKEGIAPLGLTAEQLREEAPYMASRMLTVKGIKKYAEIYFKLQSHKEEKIKEKAALKERLIAAIKKEGLGKAFPVDSANVDSSLKTIYRRLCNYNQQGIAILGQKAKDFRKGGRYTRFKWPTVKGIEKYAEIYFKPQSLKKERMALKERLIAAIKAEGLEKAFPVDRNNIDLSLKRIHKCLQNYCQKGVATLGLTAEDFRKGGAYTRFKWPTVKGIEKYAEVSFALWPHKAEKTGERIAVEKEVQKPSRSNRVQAPPPLLAKEDDRSIEEGLSPSSNAVLYESGIGLFAPLKFERPLEEPEGDIETLWEEGVLGAF